MQIAASDARVLQIGGEVLAHAFGEGHHQRFVPPGHPFPDLADEVVHLVANGFDLHFRIQQSGGTDHQFHDLALGELQFIISRRGGHKDHCAHIVFKLLKTQGTVIKSRGQPKTVIHQVLLAGIVAPEHPMHLGDGDV